ncbi:MAG: hypothetical protein AAF152_20675, partial [Cyanobacteria bacterium P01_A01_bin.114]
MAKNPKASNPKASKKLEKLFTAQPKPESGPTLWGSSILFELFLVRPWVLVGGFWLLLIMISALALGGLKDPGKELAQPVPTPETIESTAGAAVTTRLQGSVDAPQSDPAATSVAPTELSMPTWPLWALVAVCAGGCLAMSRPAVAVARRSRRRATPNSRAVALQNKRLNRHRTEKLRADQGRLEQPRLDQRRAASASKSRAGSLSKSRAGSASKSRKRLKPQQPSAQVLAIRTGGIIQRVAPPVRKPSVGGRSVPQSAGVSPKGGSPKGVSFDVKQSVITVVPANEDHPLDWQAGSLAHRL